MGVARSIEFILQNFNVESYYPREVKSAKERWLLRGLKQMNLSFPGQKGDALTLNTGSVLVQVEVVPCSRFRPTVLTG
jgi:hypothetical protein